MSEKYWLKLWLGMFTALVLIVMSLSTCTMHKNSKISETIKIGANPIEVKIAFSNSAHTAWIAVRELGRAANGGK